MRRPSILSADPASKDEETLQQQGYKQELRRDWSVLHNFGVSFSIISVITGITTLFSYGLNTGGPAVMTSGWLIVAFFTFIIGLGMAEITSGYPTSGGPYFWAAMMAPKKYSAFFSWLTGWYNLLGQVAVTTGISFGCATLVSTLVTIKNPTYQGSAPQVIGIYAAILISHGLVNTFGVHILRYLNTTSIVLHSLGVASFAIAVVAAAPTHRSASFVFSTFTDGTGGWAERASPAYVACIGILFGQYTLTGFDASAHLSEETQKASWSAPIGILTSIGVSAVFGFFLILCLLFSIQDLHLTVKPPSGQPVLQILLDIFGEDGAIVLFTLLILCVWNCGLFSLTSNSRMMFAFARDNGIPSFFHHVDKRFKAPTYTIWLGATLSFCLGLPSLGSTVAFTAATSIATSGLYISYGLPILIGLIWPSKFKKGPFDLGFASKIVAFIACCWIGFIVIIFCLPELDPVNSQTFNYCSVAVGIIGLWSIGSYLLWARHWFVGPVRQIAAEAAGLSIAPGELEEAEKDEKIEAQIRQQENEV